VLDGGGVWLTLYPGRFTPKKETQHQFHRRMGEPTGTECQREKLYPPRGFEQGFYNRDGSRPQNIPRCYHWYL